MRHDGRVRGAETGGTKERGSQVARVLSGEKGETRWECGKGKGKVSDGARTEMDVWQIWKDCEAGGERLE